MKQCIYINNQKQSRHKTTNTKNTNSRLKKPQRSKIKIEFLGGLVVDKINKIVNWPIVDKKISNLHDMANKKTWTN